MPFTTSSLFPPRSMDSNGTRRTTDEEEDEAEEEAWQAERARRGGGNRRSEEEEGGPMGVKVVDTGADEEEGKEDAEGGKPQQQQRSGSSSSSKRLKTVDGARPRSRRRLALIVLAAVLGFGLLCLGIAAITYSTLLAVIQAPYLTVEHCQLVNLSFRGSAVDAVVSIAGTITSRCRYRVEIDHPKISVYYPTVDSGVQIGVVHLASVTVPPYATMPQGANASFYDVNHAGAGVPGKDGLGAQLVKEVVNNQVSPLGLSASVPARAYIFGKTALPPVPVILHLQCLFLNRWGSPEPNASQCYTHLHPFWSKLQV